MPTWWVPVLAGLAAWWAVPDAGAAARRLTSLAALGARPGGTAPAAAGGHPSARSAGVASPGTARAAAALAGLAVAVVVGWPWGPVLGMGAGTALAVGLPRLEPRAQRRRRERLAGQAGDVADLLGACLASGAPVVEAVAAVAAAVGPPAAAPLQRLVGRMRLGADPADAWRDLADEPAFAPLARAVARSEASGAPLADALRRAADDLRARRRGELLTAARAAGVRAVLPLGVCFLPAFALLGVVPVVASLVQRLWVT